MKKQLSSPNRAARRCAGPTSALRLFLCLISAFLPALLSAQSQTNTNRPTGPSNRFLLILETSRGMKNRSEGALRSVQALFATAMGGQAHKGDTIGLWTFNEELHTGVFPLQSWSTEGYRGIAAKVMNFLNDQKFEKSSHFEKVLPTMNQVIQASDFITVILISDGSQKLEGTPFDEKVNAAFKSWRSEQEDAHMPFLTVLRAKKGKITDCTVNPAQWPIDMPPLPTELVRVVAKPAPPVKKAAPPTAPSLYLSGRKTETSPASQTTAPLSTETSTAPAAAAKLEPQPVAGTSIEAPRSQVLPPSAATISQPETTGATPNSGPSTAPPVAAKVAAPVIASPTSTPESEPDVIPAASPAANPPAAKPHQPGPVSASVPDAPALPTAASSPDSSQAVPVSPAVVLPAEPLLNLRWIIAGAIILALAVFAFLMKVMRRARAVSTSSLITRSLDRSHKE